MHTCKFFIQKGSDNIMEGGPDGQILTKIKYVILHIPEES